MSGAQVQLEAGGTFVQDPQHTLFSRTYDTREVYVAESFEIPFDKSVPAFGGTVSARIPPKGDLVRRLTVRSTLPQLYTPLGPGYVYPQYTDAVDGRVYVQTNTVAIEPGDFVGYFNTQFLSAWATNFVGYANISVSYDSTVNKFVFTSPTYSNIFFQNEGSASFWGFDIRSPDFTTTSGFPAYNFRSGTLTAPLTLVQAGWIRGFTPPPSNGFSYVDSVATKLIKSATLTVGGQTIDRLTSERLYLEQDLGVAYENQAGLTVLEGKNDTSVVSTPREYYTKLTFNMDTLNMNELYRNDVRVDIEYEKFENLASNLITTNSLTDGGSYVNTQWKTLLGISTGAGGRVQSMIFWKQYIIYTVGDTTPTFWFYDTTKPPGVSSSWNYWQSNISSSSGAGRPMTIGGNLYYTTLTTLISVPIADMLTGTAVATQGTPYLDNKYRTLSQQVDVAGSTDGIVSDARYIYISCVVNMISFGSNSAALYTTNQFTTDSNASATFNVYSIATSQLIATDNTAVLNYVQTYTPTAASNTTKNTYTIVSQTKINSNLILVSNVTYTYTSNGQPAPQTFLYILGNATNIWLRYDTTKPITDSSSYDYLSFPGTGAPKSTFNTCNVFRLSAFPFYPTSDGRYLYTSNPFFFKVDSQDFLNTTAYSNVNVSNLTPVPSLTTRKVPNASDGRYLYFRTTFNTSRTATFIRYDSTLSISSLASYSSYTYTAGPLYSSSLEVAPIGFDGKSIYYVGFSQASGFNWITAMSIFRIDSTTFTITDWIVFDGNGGAETSKGTVTNTIQFTSTNGDPPVVYNTEIPVMAVGSRYIYIGEQWDGGFQSFTDFIQFDPLTMSNVLSSSSIITKYEKYPKPPKTGKMLYGQSDVETFTIQPGAQTSEFQLRFLGPVRELWISVDAPYTIRRLILRLNGEILVDDDQVTTQTIRAFESHTSVSNVAVFNFALNPESLEPSGTLNMSRIASPMLELQLTSAPTAAANVRVYSKSYNVFQANNGTGGLLFNSAF